MPNLFPIGEEVVSTETSEQQIRTYSRSWKFDFDKGDFVLDPTGRVVEADSYTAWVQWCQKTLLTQRYRYLAYSSDYGSEYENLIGKPYTRAAIESEIQRMTKEALLVNPYTQSVDNFTFEWKDDSVYFTCTITSALGETATISRNIEEGGRLSAV